MVLAIREFSITVNEGALNQLNIFPQSSCRRHRGGQCDTPLGDITINQTITIPTGGKINSLED
jgi:hypothetical protein